jgi:hypothetical protein
MQHGHGINEAVKGCLGELVALYSIP